MYFNIWTFINKKLKSRRRHFIFDGVYYVYFIRIFNVSCIHLIHNIIFGRKLFLHNLYTIKCRYYNNMTLLQRHGTRAVTVVLYRYDDDYDDGGN